MMNLNPQAQAAMLRMMLAIQPPGGGQSAPDVGTGRSQNSGNDRWFIPDYSRERKTQQQQQADVDRQRTRSRRQDRMINVLQWRDNLPMDRLNPVRPQEAIARIPAFNDTGVDERYLAFKNFLNYGTVNPGFSTYGQGGYA